MDNAMIRFILQYDCRCRFNERNAFSRQVQTVVDDLAPMQVALGTLQEWMRDWDNAKDRHRHVSHLWGLYPGRQISAYNSPILFEAAKKSLTGRGDHSTGWSMGWKVCLWARLLNGDQVPMFMFIFNPFLVKCFFMLVTPQRFKISSARFPCRRRSTAF